MSRHRSRLVRAALALLFGVISVVLWPSLSAPTAYATCNPPLNDVCLSSSPTVVSTLNGHDQTLSYTLAFTLQSVLGNWHVSVTSTQFATGSNHSLPTTASQVTAVATVPACSGLTCPNNQVTYPVGVPAGNAANPVTFYDSVGATQGIGSFNIQATVQVAVPGNAYAGTYNSTITIALATGP